MTTEEQIVYLNTKLNEVLAELSRTQEELRVAKEDLHAMQEKLQRAQSRMEELEKQKTSPPAFVKANKKKLPEEEKKARKKREAKHNQARPRSMPTQVVEHRVMNCPTCDLRLGGISLARVREVIFRPRSTRAGCQASSSFRR